MLHGSSARTRGRRAAGAAVVAVLGLLAVACQPASIGVPPTNLLGNGLANDCPQGQPVSAAPCGPRPLFSEMLNGPFAAYEDGDPYATLCAPGGGSGPSCVRGNASYRAAGHTFVINVPSNLVNHRLHILGYDVGAASRSVGAGGAGKVARRGTVTTTSGSTTITWRAADPPYSQTFEASDVGQPILGAWCQTNCLAQTITAVGGNPTTATLSAPAEASGMFTAQIGFDCNTSAAPFDSPFYAGMTARDCRVGDEEGPGGQNIAIEAFDSDGTATPQFTRPLREGNECAASLPASTLRRNDVTAYFDDVHLCSFYAEKPGAYGVVVRSSSIAGLPDVGSGSNKFALQVTYDVEGGEAVSPATLQPYGEHTIEVMPSTSAHTQYLMDVPKAFARKKLVVDLFDAGDGNGADPITLQVKAPPGGAPARTPAETGATVPAAGIATACAYTPTGSASQGGGALSPAATCTATTHTAGSNPYDGKWLRFEITLDAGYTCSSDCWWTLH